MGVCDCVSQCMSEFACVRQCVHALARARGWGRQQPNQADGIFPGLPNGSLVEHAQDLILSYHDGPHTQ